MNIPDPSFSHLSRLTDSLGLFEHAEGILARRHCGYCVDDVARGLVVVSRAPDSPDSFELQELSKIYLSFLLAAQTSDGRFRNRLDTNGQWEDRATVEDCWGRALFALGSAASSPYLSTLSRDAAVLAFETGAQLRSPWRRSMAYAALGAAAILRVIPNNRVAISLLLASAHQIGRPRKKVSWPWPESRLTYGNAVLPEALLAAGIALDDRSLQADGLTLLGWLLDAETHNGHLSVTPVRGRGHEDLFPAFDQQSIEVAAIADACARAYEATGESRWARGLELAVSWFLGNNDSGIWMYDQISGGGYDGLERHGRNENQGAESTLAVLSTFQQGRLLQAISR